MNLLDQLKVTATEIIPGLIGDGQDVLANMPQITAILEGLDDILADGFQWNELDDVFSEVVLPLFGMAGQMTDKTGPEKKQFVLDAVSVIYAHINPDIPLIPESIFGIKIESRVEAFFVPKIAGVAVEIAYKIYKKMSDLLGEKFTSEEIEDFALMAKAKE